MSSHSYLSRFSKPFRSFFRSTATFTSLLILAIAAAPLEAVLVNIPDPGLRAKVEAALGKGSGDPIDSTEMETLTVLSATSASITNLTGLETATNLELLFIYSNSIADLSPIAGLSSLTRLDADFNQISDLSPLAALTNLDYINVRNNLITDMDDLAALTAMVTLNISENSIDDITGLANMTLLENLLATDNAINDLFPLAALTNLKQLNLNNNEISDIIPLGGLINMLTLRLSNNRIADIAAIANMSVIDILDVSNNYVDTNVGSDDRAILDALPGGTTIIEAPQKTMTDYPAWVATWSIPISQDDKADTNGPLQFINLIAYSMALDPFTSIPNQTPYVTRESGTDTHSFFYYRDQKAAGIQRIINAGPDLASLAPVTPDTINVLTDDGNGVQYVEAVFEIPGIRHFFQLEVIDY